ncbi:MAG: helix-turn-helix domain-containing protein [Acidobacteriota bacterium]
MRILKVLRTIKGEKQDDLARKTGISQPRISLLENGHRQPTERELTALAEALGTEPRFLSREISATTLLVV